MGSIFWKTSDTALYSTYVSTVVIGIKNGVRERGGEDKSGNGLENKMEKSKRGGDSELRDGTMMLYLLLDPRRVQA